MKFIDLFAGTGSFSFVFSSKEYDGKFECVLANDIDENSKLIYELNMSENKFICDDLNNIELNDIPEHDILCAGFPCQPFSIAGNQKGFEDERSNVIWKLLSIIEYRKPKIVILENVKNFKSHDEERTYKIIKDNIKSYGYYIKSYILDTCEVTSIPQHRERLFIICFKDKDIYDKFYIEYETKPSSIKDYLEENIPKKYYYSDKLKVYETIKENVVKHISTNTIYQYRRYYVRENKNQCCPTLTCNMGKGGHNVPLLLDDFGIRKLTPRECFNLQGFPKDFKLPKLSDNKLYSLVGNSISPPVIKLISDKLFEIYQ